MQNGCLQPLAPASQRQVAITGVGEPAQLPGAHRCEAAQSMAQRTACWMALCWSTLLVRLVTTSTTEWRFEAHAACTTIYTHDSTCNQKRRQHATLSFSCGTAVSVLHESLCCWPGRWNCSCTAWWPSRQAHPGGSTAAAAPQLEHCPYPAWPASRHPLQSSLGLMPCMGMWGS